MEQRKVKFVFGCLTDANNEMSREKVGKVTRCIHSREKGWSNFSRIPLLAYGYPRALHMLVAAVRFMFSVIVIDGV
jgi:hypothetical protein